VSRRGYAGTDLRTRDNWVDVVAFMADGGE
jgi:hypothetical protein